MTVGGYSADNSSAHVLPLSLTTASTTFYWVVPGTFQVTLSCLLSNGQSASAQTTFSVSGPTSPAVTPQLGLVQITENTRSIWRLHITEYRLSFGNGYVDPAVPSITGIIFRASANLPPGDTGTFRWVQLLDEAKAVETTLWGSQTTCTDVSGGELDNSYPYSPDGPATDDSPSWPLSGLETEVDYAFKARMFLLWLSALPASIPVPLGYTAWGFSGIAHRDFSLVEWDATGTRNASPFQEGVVYPEWTKVVENREPPCNIVTPRR